jgi:hypothetical protein
LPSPLFRVLSNRSTFGSSAAAHRNNLAIQNGASSDDVGHAFQSEAGHLFQSEAGRRSDLMSATGVLLPPVGLDDVLVDGVGQVVVVRMAALLELFQFQNR